MVIQFKCLPIYLVLVFLPFFTIKADNYPRNPNIDIQHYTFRLHLNDSTNVIKGEATIRVKILETGLKNFALDLINKKGEPEGMQVDRVTYNDRQTAFNHQEDRLRLEFPHSLKKDTTIAFTVHYQGIPADGLIISNNRYGNRTFFGDNWPNRARNWLPVIDHPYDKATCRFEITTPAHYQVIANGHLVEETDLKGNKRLTIWETTKPLPTKVMVIGVARFAVRHLQEMPSPNLQSWVFPQDKQRGFKTFNQAVPILQFFENYIAPYPYEKLANVQSKTIYGGMENAGNIFYYEAIFRTPGTKETLMAHEIAHQWFGNTVSEKDWHHLWLSEGFATYFAQLYRIDQYGVDSLLAGMRRAKNQVFNYYSRFPKATVVDTTITDLNRLLNPYNYQKGAWVLHMLRDQVGRETFKEGIRQFYRQFQFGNALTEDFLKVMEKISGDELDWFFDQWLYKQGLPQVQASWKFRKLTNQVILDLNQVQAGGTLFRLPIELVVKNKDGTQTRTHQIILKEKNQKFKIPFEGIPEQVILDPEGKLLMQSTIYQD